MIKSLIFVFYILFSCLSIAQSITGKFTQLANQEIKLEGFNGFKTYPISTATMDEKGNFKLAYNKADYGVGYLMSADNKPFFVILSGEDVEVSGEASSYGFAI